MKMGSQVFQIASRWRKAPAIVVLISSFAVLVLHAYLGGHTRMIADDFCSAHFARRLGLLRSIWFWYNNWSGRYGAFGADWVMEKFGPNGVPLIPPLMLLSWFVFTVLALYLWLRRALPAGDSKLAALTLAAAFLFVVLLLSPHVPQSLYWWNAMRPYSLPLFLLTVCAVLFQTGVERLHTKKGIWIGNLLSFLFLFIIGGTGETYLIFQLSLLAALIALEWLVWRDVTSVRFQLLLAGFLGSVAALVILFVAPGNVIRRGLYPPPPDLITLLQIAGQSYLAFLFDILQTPAKVAGLLGAMLIAFWLGTQREQAPLQSWLIPILFVGSLMLSFGSVLPGVYATSEPSAPRTLIVPVFALVGGLMVAGFLLGGQWMASGKLSQSAGSISSVLGVFFIAYAALINGQALYNSRNVYIEFAQRWQLADTLIREAKARGDESVTIPAMKVWTGPGGDPIDNPRYWVNQCYSVYYGINVLGPNVDNAE